MTLIVFMLLVIIVLAVGVRVVETRSKVVLTIALLVAVGLSLRSVAQHTAFTTDGNSALATENPGQEAPVADAEAAQPESAGNVEAIGSVPADSDSAVASEALSDPTRLEMDVEVESFEGDEGAGRDVDDPACPDWVGDSQLVCDFEGVDLKAVLSVCDDRRELESTMDSDLEKAVSDYIGDYLRSKHGRDFDASTIVHYDATYIRANLLDEHWPGGPYYSDAAESEMYRSAALLKFTPEFREEFERPIIVGGRLRGTALVFGTVLALLAVVSGYFRLDTATRGFYSGRLQYLAAVAILAVIIAGALLAKSVPWM